MPVITQNRYGSQTPTSGSNLLFVFSKWEADNAGGGAFTVDIGNEEISTGATPHDLEVDEIARFFTDGSSTLPAPLAVLTNYWVVEKVDDFIVKVSLTKGGAPVNIATAGSGGVFFISRWEEDATQWEIETSADGVTWTPYSFVVSPQAYLADLTITPALAYRVRVSAPQTSQWMEQALEFPIILGPDIVDCEIGVRPMARLLRSNSATSLPGDWAISGAPPGVGITNDDEPIAGYLGGAFNGAATQDGEFPAVVTWRATPDTGNETFDQRRVLFRVSGPSYIADFHTDRSRTGVLIDIRSKVAAGWQFENGALPVDFGDAFTLHAVLRDGATYVAAGVTDLLLICKLKAQRDCPQTFRFFSATPAVDTFGTVKAWPLAVEFKGPLIERLLAVVNAPAVAAEASRALEFDAQFSWTHGARRWIAKPFTLSVRQPLVLR